MNQAQSPDKLQVRIRCAADLFQAVRDPRLEVQLPTLRGIMDDPPRALQFGKHEGGDIIDVLVDLTRSEPEALLHQARLMALLCYREPRAHAALLAEFERELDGQLAITLADRLAMEPLELTRPVFRPLLSATTGARATAAALVLRNDATLTAAERLRIASILGCPECLPAWGEAELGAWCQEATLPGSEVVREHLRSNAPAFACLVVNFSTLPESVQSWIISHADIHHVAEWAARLEASAPLRAATARLLQAGASMPPEITAGWLRHLDPQIRLAAIALGAADADLQPWLAPHQPMPLRVAALRRLATQSPGGVLPYIEAPEWELRATATELLARHRSTETLAALQQLALRPGSSPARTAAAQALLQLGEADWVEENLLAPVFGQASGQENLRD